MGSIFRAHIVNAVCIAVLEAAEGRERESNIAKCTFATEAAKNNARHHEGQRMNFSELLRICTCSRAPAIFLKVSAPSLARHSVI